MPVHFDHLIIPTRDRVGSARLLGTLLGVPWAEQASVGPFSAVYVNDGLTIDFDAWTDAVPKLHYAFRVDDGEFDGILARVQAAGIAFRSTPHGPDDGVVNAAFGGRLIYWSEPDGHTWEVLTVSYVNACRAPPRLCERACCGACRRPDGSAWRHPYSGLNPMDCSTAPTRS